VVELGRVRYAITTEESEARFNMDETIGGEDIIVIGVTSEIAGEVIVDFDSPITSQVGMIRINVRTLETPNPFRNRALRSDILESAQDQYEFAEFTPTSLDGLPDSAAIGDVVDFQITGDLNLHGVTRSLTFDAQVTLVSEERIEGVASTTVLYQDFDIVVPMPPSVSFIGEEVLLEIDFVALAVEE
jgi:polyisoprenoid-binding protein YceI